MVAKSGVASIVVMAVPVGLIERGRAALISAFAAGRGAWRKGTRSLRSELLRRGRNIQFSDPIENQPEVPRQRWFNFDGIVRPTRELPGWRRPKHALRRDA